MTRFIHGTPLQTALCVLSLALLGFVTRSAHGQESDADLRRQNQQLAAEVQDLEKELVDLRERNRQLEARIAELEAKLDAALKSPPSPPPARTTSSGPALDPEEITVDESVPNASPRALFKALIASYENAMDGIEIGRTGTGAGTNSGPDRVRRAYLKRLESWRALVNREFRSPIKWHVRVIDARVGPDNQRLITLIAVDPVTDVRLGNTFDVALSQTLVDRLARYDSRGELGVLIMRGTLIPEVRINAERDVRGSFDNPPFIGPFAEFLFRIDVTSLVQPREEPATTTPAGEREAATTPP